MLRKYFIIIVFILTQLFIISSYQNVFAADFKADYQVEYFLNEFKDKISTQVKFNVQITNLATDIYVKKFSLLFPKSFKINNIQAFDDKGDIIADLVEDDLDIKINLQFKDPNIGKGTVNNIYLQFNQDNLFNINGNVWEVILPSIENRGPSIYKIIVNLPESTNKKISFSKPKPDYITGNQIIWNNPTEKTIYAVFGNVQNYQLDLTYHLSNSKIYPVFTEIAYPPDTQYQKTYIQSISEKPESVRQDEDGNYLAKYFLKPKENKIIIYKGITEIFANPREEVIPAVREKYSNQKPYLLTETKYWNYSKIKVNPSLKDVKSIHDFTVNALRYDFKAINETKERLGAFQALQSPDRSVCVEYADLFIALTRQVGIPSRELEGYGFSQDSRLRPLSLSSDILHSWPEYFDENKNLWVPIDPTWEHTSGIDYFHSLDLNHIVFAIHGKESDYPLPAGMYKIENSKDVLVKPTSENVQNIQKIDLHLSEANSEIIDTKKYLYHLLIKNLGNTYIWNIPINLSSKDLEIVNSEVMINSLAPYEERKISIQIQSKLKNVKKPALLTIQALNFKKDFSFTIIPSIYKLAFSIFTITIFIFVPLSLIFIYKYYKNK